ncbi:MAG: hypothetical protein BA863_05995 [Desulfovibrio sp. S3730MH75]|nr:MAG: hypothetical protein BA863_05995 [Desulfovibrio sp. S3730MH75]
MLTNKNIIILMWVIIAPTYYLFEYLFNLINESIILMIVPVLPYLFLLFLLSKNKDKSSVKLFYVITPGIICCLPTLCLLFIFWFMAL